MPAPQKRTSAPRRPSEAHRDDRVRSPDTPMVSPADAAPPPSKSQRKRDAQALQVLGAQLVVLAPAPLARLELPEALREAVETARGLRAHGARARHRQYMGKLMRQLDPAVLQRIRETLESQRAVLSRPWICSRGR